MLGYKKIKIFYKITAIYGRLKIPHFSMFSWCAGVNQHPSTFWSITLQPLDAEQATIQLLKGDIHSFHMSHSSLICSKRLHQNQATIRNTILALVDLLLFLRMP